MSKAESAPRKPEWLKIKIRGGENLSTVHGLLSRYALNTVCREANCPNRMECYGSRTAAFMILGAVCTRQCAFCNVRHGPPQPVDSGEPGRIAEVSGRLGLRYVVITSVTRDDLCDGGASHFAHVIRVLKTALPEILVEALIPDFQGQAASVAAVLAAQPDVLHHNVETVPRLYPAVRLLERAKKPAGDFPGRGIQTKSGLMVGLGETPEEVEKVFYDLREAGCDFLTIGQYLAPSARHYPVAEYIHPRQFEEYRRYARSLGFSGVAAGPFVRSSYRAAELAAPR